ncbi:MAG: YicC family protein [Verrucomicrobiales bacterium]|nr:YicC family protein [Verrucomicrobiales bacterium]
MKSMTGFGRGEADGEGLRCVAELSSVNRKQADIDLRLPRDGQALEAGVRKLLNGALSRGRLSASINLESTTSAASTALRVDEALAVEYAAALAKLSLTLATPLPLSADALLRAPGVFTVTATEPLPLEVTQPLVLQAVAQALIAWDEARLREGAYLRQDLTNRLETLQDLCTRIAAEAPRVPMLHREALRRRLEEIGLPLPLNDERLVKEIALFADRCDISEEISRLAGHLLEFHRLMDSRDPSGRPLDFLTQEMHRELNTMGAKASHAGIAHLVVAGKTEVERLREQVQNVE